MKLISALIVLMTAVSVPSSARAQQVNYRQFEKEGFGDVGRLLQSMTPKQRAAILEQAAIKEKDLKQLTPQQLEQLRKQLRGIANTMEIDKIDPAKLDISQPKTAADVKKDSNNGSAKRKAGY